MSSAEEILKRVDELTKQIKSDRQGLYQDQWVWMSLDSLLYAAIYKAERARLTQDLGKKLDDILDAINYLRFSAAKLLCLLGDQP